jgi:hypothetical protein
LSRYVTDVSDLPAPREGAPAGYYPDPLRTGRARWWDGSGWTLTVGPRVEADAPMTEPVPPPTKVCPRCAAQSQTFASNCPHCGRNYTLSSPWKIVAISIAALLLTVGGCGACVAVGLKFGDEELEKHSITRGEYAELKLGTPQSTIEDRLGDPVSRDRVEGRPCIYYDEKDTSLFSGLFFELCFENRRLVTKDAY